MVSWRGKKSDPERVVMVEERRDHRDGERRDTAPDFASVRDEDLRPHEGLRYIARLFKMLSALLVLLLVGEVIIGVVRMGMEAVPTLLIEATRLIVFAGFLWGAGDLALMLINSNHDLRASRILLGRINGKMGRMLDMEYEEAERISRDSSLRPEVRSEHRPDVIPPQRPENRRERNLENN
ncbi:MAG: hypothetical protein LBG44_04380 [Gemmatimonadota bacterium]|jgi:hypothetical protein|nr:hypothetical protein [Gemmatimonadota bacterium]